MIDVNDLLLIVNSGYEILINKKGKKESIYFTILGYKHNMDSSVKN